MRWTRFALCVGLCVQGCVATTGDRTTIENRLTSLENRIDGVGADASRASKGTAQLEGTLDSRISTIHQRQLYLRKDLQELLVSVPEMQRELASLRHDVALVRNRIDAIEAGGVTKSDSVDSEVKRLEIANRNLLREVESLKNQVGQTNTKADSLSKRFSTTDSDLRQQVQLLDREIDTLYSEILKVLGLSKPESGYHVVKQGESLGQIAAKYGVRLSDILKANPSIKNPGMIRPGQKIKVP